MRGSDRGWTVPMGCSGRAGDRDGRGIDMIRRRRGEIRAERRFADGWGGGSVAVQGARVVRAEVWDWMRESLFQCVGFIVLSSF